MSKLPKHASPFSSPQRDGIVIRIEGRFHRNRHSGSSALEECGRFKLWVIGLLRDGILFMGLDPRS